MNSGLAKGKDIWIGGSDGQKDRTWYWVGTDLVWGYSNWDSGTEKNFVSSQLVKRGGRREKRGAAKSKKELVSTDI